MAGCADDVASWLDKLGLAEYTDKFLCGGYSSLSQCVGLTKADLNAIGVVKAGHLNRLVRDLDRMKLNSGWSESESVSPTNSVSPLSPVTPPLVDTKQPVPPTVPLRRTLQHKPKSEGVLLEAKANASPPKLMPRKQSLRKSRSAIVVSPVDRQRHSMYAVGENEELDFSSEGKLSISCSFGKLTDLSRTEPQPASSVTLPRVPPPVAPRKSHTRTQQHVSLFQLIWLHFIDKNCFVSLFE